METVTLTAEKHIIDALVDFLKAFKNEPIEIIKNNEPVKLNAIPAFGLFAKGNENVDFDEIENDLKLLSKQCEQHILDEWDLDNV